MSDNQRNEFGNRHHGRFPRVGVTVEDDHRGARANYFLVTATRNRHGYENPGFTLYMSLSRLELTKLIAAGTEALKLRRKSSRNRPRSPRK